MINAGERRVQTVVVLLRNRIKLVIVTTGAADRQPEKCFARGADDFVNRIGAYLRRLSRIGISNNVQRTANKKSKPDFDRRDRRAASASPARCSITNRSNGLSSFSDRIT